MKAILALEFLIGLMEFKKLNTEVSFGKLYEVQW